VKVLRRALGAFGLKPAEEEQRRDRPDYQSLMQSALSRIRMAELQIQEATSLEDLDIGRSSMMAGWAEVQQLVRAAKRERGISVRPISETEEMHRNLRDRLYHRPEVERTPSRRRTGTER